MKSIIEDAIDRKRKLEEQAHEQYKKNCCEVMLNPEVPPRPTPPTTDRILEGETHPRGK